MKPQHKICECKEKVIELLEPQFLIIYMYLESNLYAANIILIKNRPICIVRIIDIVSFRIQGLCHCTKHEFYFKTAFYMKLYILETRRIKNITLSFTALYQHDLYNSILTQSHYTSLYHWSTRATSKTQVSRIITNCYSEMYFYLKK